MAGEWCNACALNVTMSFFATIFSSLGHGRDFTPSTPPRGYVTVYDAGHFPTIVLKLILNEYPYKQLPSIGNGREGEYRYQVLVVLNLPDRYSKRGEGLTRAFKNVFSS